MPTLVWDEVGERTYETGVERGVVYPNDGDAVVWNGLISIDESVERKVTPKYYDGVKVQDSVSIGEFKGVIRAITYPEIITELEGFAEIYPGMYADEQMPQVFGLSYRSIVGNDVDGNEHGYKIHVLYNVTLTPKNTTRTTITNQANISEFQWDIFATPEYQSGFRPASHFVIDSRSIEESLLSDVEETLYGGNEDAYLPDMVDFISLVRGW